MKKETREILESWMEQGYKDKDKLCIRHCLEMLVYLDKKNTILS